MPKNPLPDFELIESPTFDEEFIKELQGYQQRIYDSLRVPARFLSTEPQEPNKFKKLWDEEKKDG
jgi:hypothetical protein